MPIIQVVLLVPCQEFGYIAWHLIITGRKLYSLKTYDFSLLQRRRAVVITKEYTHIYKSYALISAIEQKITYDNFEIQNIC